MAKLMRWILFSVLSFVLLPPQATAQSDPQSSEEGAVIAPLTDHIKVPKCILGQTEDYEPKYALSLHVAYSDGKQPFDALVEVNQPDIKVITAQCEAFLNAMHEAQIEEWKSLQMAANKASIETAVKEMKRKHDAHFFLDAKIAKK